MDELIPVEFWSHVFDWYIIHTDQDRHDAEGYFIQALRDAGD